MRVKKKEEWERMEAFETEKKQVLTMTEEAAEEERRRKERHRNEMLKLQSTLRGQIAGVNAKRRSVQAREREDFAR